jgi:SAM-dependent methyltransferase
VNTDAVGELKQKHHATWAAGDYADIAELVAEVGANIAEAAEIEAGQDVLDVACGTGNAALVAAGKGANVTGLDLTPELFDRARERAAETGVEVQWVEGDAEDLPYDDASFDRVLSAIGIQFAPRHEVVAKELARVCRPGGLIVLGNWSADGMIGEMFKLMGGYLPKPPDFVSSPALWGDEDHVRGLFDGLGVELSFDRRTCVVPFESAEENVEVFEAKYGPTIKAKEALEPEGKWDELRQKWLELIERNFEPGKGVAQDYFIITGRRT